MKGRYSTKCACGAEVFSDDPTPEEKAEGFNHIYRCVKCGTVIKAIRREK
ncbi:MAG TPA: hypothetical protein VGB32_02935 [Candidatus Bathyarchaeia archaeon]